MVILMSGVTIERGANRWRVAPPAAVCLLFLALLVQPFSATGQARKVSLEELTRSSSSVLLGKTISQRSFWNDSGTKIFTEVTIQVQDRIKGEADAETVITIPGGRVGNTLYEVSDMPVFVDNEETLVFLWESSSGKQIVSGGVQGKMIVVDDVRRGGKVVRGAAHLFEPAAASKIGEAKPPLRQVALEDVLAVVRRVKNE